MPTRPVDVFLEDFDPVLLKGIAAGMRDSYASAGDLLRDSFSDKAVKGNTYPWIRRGLIEDMLLKTCTQFGATIQLAKDFSVAQEASNFFWYHVEIQVGRIVLTQAAASTEQTVIRSSGYREDLAKETQRLLFVDADDIDPAGRVSAALVHNRHPDDWSKVGFAQIRFPRIGAGGKLNGYHDGHIDLRIQFPEVFDGDISSSEERIDDTAMPIPIQNRAAE